MAENSFAWPSFSPMATDFNSQDPDAGGESAREEARQKARQKAGDEAREQARQEGYALGLAKAEEETARLHQALQESLATLSATAAQLQTECSEAIVELAMSVVHRLLLVELRANPTVLETLVSEALEVLNAKLNDVQVLLNPEDYAMLHDRDATSPFAAMQLKEDAGVPLGGVSVSRGQQSVEFDPLGRLEAYSDQEYRDGTASITTD